MPSQRPKREPTTKPAPSVAEPAPVVEEAAPLVVPAKVKGDRTTLSPRTLVQLQTLAGNRAVTSILPLQRHTISGAPAAPPPLEEELPLQGFWGAGLPVQRWEKGVVKGGAKGGGGKGAPAPVWKKGAPGDKAAKGDVKLGAKRVSLGPVALSAKELKADGASSLTASLPKAGGRAVTWGISAPAGTKIDAKSGVVSAGADAGGVEFAKVPVHATDNEVPTATAKGLFTLWSSDAWQAKIDVPALLKSGPLVKKAYKASFNGVYDATYTPGKRLLLIEVPIQFDFPDDPITAKMSAKRKAATHKRLAGYRWRFISNVQKQWGGRFTFSMAREPKSFWGALGPVRVKVKVFEPKNKAASYFTVHYKSKTTGRAQVAFPDVDLFRGDLSPDRAFRKETLAGEKTQLERIANPVNVDAKGNLDAASDASVKFLGDYIKRLRQPPVRLALTGKDAKKASAGLARAQAVRSRLIGYGVVAPHAISARGAVDPADQRVHIAPRVSSTYINFTDVSAHEFGHMLGLPDEYPEGARKIGDKLRTYDRLVKAFGQDYADQVGKVTPSTASIMHGGDQVRVQHYIHFWDTLILVSNLHATVPTKKFGDADWKING